MTGTCELCSRENLTLTKHHLIPRQKHNRKAQRDHEDLSKSAAMCRSCQNQIHAFFPNKILAEELNTIEKLKAVPLVEKWIAWIGKHG